MQHDHILKNKKGYFALSQEVHHRIIPCLDDAFIPIEDHSIVLQRNKCVRLNTWTEPVPVQLGSPQHLGLDTDPSLSVLILVHFYLSARQGFCHLFGKKIPTQHTVLGHHLLTSETPYKWWILLSSFLSN